MMRLRAAWLVLVPVAFGEFAACSKREPTENASPPSVSDPALSASADEPSASPSPKPAASSPLAPAKPAEPKPSPTMTPDSRESSPAPRHPQFAKVRLHTTTSYSCAGRKDPQDGVRALPQPHGARITVAGQGPCPGEVREWSAQINLLASRATEKRIDVQASHGTPSKCLCHGTGEFVLAGLEPGTYDVHIKGGFNRPIATRVVVP